MIAIVGAGIAGLCCAFRLQRLGLQATVYEASHRVGGRMLTFHRAFADKMSAELGGEFIDSSHRTLLGLAAELSIGLLDYRTDDPTLADLTVYLKGGRVGLPELLESYAPIAAHIDAALATLTGPKPLSVSRDKPNGAQALDAHSIASFLDSVHASGPARTLLELAYTTEFGLDASDSSALNLLLQISTDTTKLLLLGASDERYRAKGGNDTFPRRLAEALGPSAIELGTTLVALARTPAGRYLLTFEAGSRRQQVVADHVVLALPFTMLRAVECAIDWPPVKRWAIQELGMGTNAKLLCGFSTRPWRTRYHANGQTFSDLGYQSTWEASRLQETASGILTNYLGGGPGIALGRGTAEDRGAEFMTELDLVFPGVRAAHDGRLVRMHWPTYPLTKGSYSAYRVGQYTRFAGVERTRFENVHFCGEHTSVDAQGFMEGAAETGTMAAAELAADLGLSIP